MARAIHVPKTHLIMALCLPLAVILGYFLAEPLDSGSLAVVVFVMTILIVPLLIKWYHPFLVLSWNAGIAPVFLPGQPALWMCFSLAGILLAALNRSINPDCRFTNIPPVTKSLLFVLGVVLATAYVTGGFGIRSLGAARYGGRAYFYIFAAVAGYFALTSYRIPVDRAKWYLGMFFLPAIITLAPNMIKFVGASTPFFALFFPINSASASASLAGPADPYSVYRVSGLGFASTGLGFYLLARYGIREIVSLNRVFVSFLSGVALVGCAACGYRSMLILFGVAVFVLFFAEGLHRTKMLPASIGLGILCMCLLFAFATKLPWSIQRTLSVLPIKVDEVVKADAEVSTKWRLEMWRDVLPEIPKYLFVGKGYGLNPDDLYWINAEQWYLRTPNPHGNSILAGDYHNGPLSVIIPFGILGVISFVWFATAGILYLYRCAKFGRPELRQINSVIFSIFVAKTVLFLFIAGSFYSDLFIFTGLLGLAVSLNGQVLNVEPTEKEEEAFEPFSSIAAGRDSAQYG